MRIFGFVLFLLTTPVFAQPVAYTLDKKRSIVQFTYLLDGNPAKGTMPVQSAQIVLDANNIANSRVTTKVNAKGAKAGIAFVTQTLRGPKMLDAANHPVIDFKSTKVTGTFPKGQMAGQITLKGQTRPITLNAEVFRTQGSTDGDMKNLLIVLTGRVDRRKFGITGFSSMVGPHLDLRIKAYLTRK